MSDPHRVSEHELIRRTIARNNQALDDRRYEDCAATFTEDGSIAGHHGRAAILEFMHSQRLGADAALQRRHVVTNIAIDVSGEQASLKPVVERDRRVLPQLGDKPTLATKPSKPIGARPGNHEPLAADRAALERPRVLQQERPVPIADPAGHPLDPDEAR